MIKRKIITVLKIIFGRRTVVKNIKVNIVQLSPNELLQDRTAIITGGSSGIGLSIARAMLMAGSSVVITGRNEVRLKESCTYLSQFKKNVSNISYEVMDNAKICELETHFNNIIEKIGEAKISILVNNAGVSGDIDTYFGSAEEQAFNAVIDTNLKGAFFLSQIVAKYMKDNKIEGNILNIASSSSLRPVNSAYTLSKWGIKGLTLGLAKLLIPYHIVVNAIAPGPTATQMLHKESSENINFSQNPCGRLAIPEEIANMAVIMTSGLGRMAVGNIIYMSGGAGVLTYDDVNYDF